MNSPWVAVGNDVHVFGMCSSLGLFGKDTADKASFSPSYLRRGGARGFTQRVRAVGATCSSLGA